MGLKEIFSTVESVCTGKINEKNPGTLVIPAGSTAHMRETIRDMRCPQCSKITF